jgi:two-component system sensor histidine kinase CpxA
MKLSLRWKILAWALLNLALIAGTVVWFLHAQFQLGVNSLLAGSTGVRLDAIARQLAPELGKRQRDEWPAALEEAVGYWRSRGVRVALVHNSGAVEAGDIPAIPDEVTSALSGHNAKMGAPPSGRGGRLKWRGPGSDQAAQPQWPAGPAGAPGILPDRPSPGGPSRAKPPGDFFPAFGGPGANDGVPFDDRNGPTRTVFPVPSTDANNAVITPTTTFEKFMLVSSNPRCYWAGVHLDNSKGPLPFTLLLASDSIRGGGLFFDYVPWLWLGTALAVISLLLWLPLVHILTKTLEKLTASAENIAAGCFETPPGTRRGDELGRLQNAHRHMAQRLDGFVTGQKRFLGDTAHELLSPLARLEVALSILEQRAKNGERGTLDRALGEVRRIAALVHELLAFSKSALSRRDAPLETVPLAELVREALERESGEARIEMLVADDLSVMAVPQLLKRAIENVIRNAVRYAAADGPIRISAGRANAWVVLKVSDAGPGVPESALPNLFDPFFRPDSSRTTATGGTGLGLAIVKTCAEACQGKVTAANLSPRGFAVEMTLAAAPSASEFAR